MGDERRGTDSSESEGGGRRRNRSVESHIHFKIAILFAQETKCQSRVMVGYSCIAGSSAIDLMFGSKYS